MPTLDDCDWIIKCGRGFRQQAFTPTSAFVAIRDDRIVGVGGDLPLGVTPTHDFPEAILLPGLVDLHAHIGGLETTYGVDADRYSLPFGVTTIGSQGDAGADNVSDYITDVIKLARTRVRLALNISRIGETSSCGACSDPANLNVDACVEAAVRHRREVWAIAVNASHHSCGDVDPKRVLEAALIAAEQSGLPLLYGMRRPEDWPLRDQLERLRSGDVVTYCFRRTPHCIVKGGRVLAEVVDARARGVLFDIGHGCGSFDFDVAREAIDDNFPPNTISTDLQRGHLAGESPVHHLPRVMSKLSACGLGDEDLLVAVTGSPAKLIARDEPYGLAIGRLADICVLTQGKDALLDDTSGNRLRAATWKVLLTLRRGKRVKAGDVDVSA